MNRSRPLVMPLALLLAGASLAAACGDNSKSSATPIAATCAPADGSAKRTVQFSAAPPMCLVDGKRYVAIIETSEATLRVDLRADIAPNTVNNFVNLARFHYFDGTTCHRAVQNFVVQCGRPSATGSDGPGYEFADELAKIEPYRIGSLAMANHGANTNGSQWFIVTGDDGTVLAPKYTLFGQVEDNDLGNLVLLDKIANPADGPPLQPIDIISVRIEEK